MLLEKTVKIKKSNLFNYFVKKTANFPSSTFNLGISMEFRWKMAVSRLISTLSFASCGNMPFNCHFPTQFLWKCQDFKWKMKNSRFFWQNNWTNYHFLSPLIACETGKFKPVCCLEYQKSSTCYQYVSLLIKVIKLGNPWPKLGFQAKTFKFAAQSFT